MTAPDHLSYSPTGETDEGLIDFVPILRDPCQAPGNPPEWWELNRAVQVVLWHLIDGHEEQDDEHVTYAHVVTDLNRRLNLDRFLALVRDHTWMCDTHPDGYPREVADHFLYQLEEYLTANGYRRQP